MKVVVLIGDGMADRPVKELGGKTPLEFAQKPNMDSVAEEGECGIMDPIGVGIRAGSDTSHLAILGYDPHKYYTGRGAFECAGVGLDVKQGDVSFRCNFATIDVRGIVLDRRAGLISEGTHKLALPLNDMKVEDVTIFFKESTGHRAAMILRGKGLGHNIPDIDPHKEGVIYHRVDGKDMESRKTARILNTFVEESRRILSAHPLNKEREREGKKPANIILPRGCSIAPDLKSFAEKYSMKGACIVEVGLIKGIGRYLGMDVIDVPGATGSYDSDIPAIGKKLLEVLPKYDFVLCNIKGPDRAGHDGNAKAKVEFIEKIDGVVGELLPALPEESVFILTADHSTPVSIKDHSGDAVPIVFRGTGVRVDNVKEYGERSLAHGGLGRIKGMDVMNILTNLISTQEKFGA